ncbi:hypothetical protein TCSYLVIO_008635, partial [Trypanosoma cruzi]
AVLYCCTLPALLVTCSGFANKWASGVSPPSRISCCYLASFNSSLLLAATSNRRRSRRTGRGIAASLVRCRTPSRFFMRSFVPNGDVLFHLPHLRQSLPPVLCHKPRANIDVQRQSGLPLPKLRQSPHRTPQLRNVGLRLHALRQSRVIRVEFFQRLRKLLHALRKKTMTVGALVHIFFIHQLLPLRVLTQTIPTGLLMHFLLQRHQVIKQTLTCALVHQRRYHDTAPINDDPHRVAAAVGAPNSNPARRGIAWRALKKVLASPWQMLPLFCWQIKGTPLFIA